MSDEKIPKPKVVLDDADPSAPEPTPASARDAGNQTASESDGCRTGASRVSAWVRRTFPGHENAFWGGVCGLVVALVFFAIGFWRTVLIGALILVGVAVGQLLDGNPSLIDVLRRLFSRNQ